MTIERNLLTDADGDFLNITSGNLPVSDAAANESLNAIEADADSINTILTNAKDPLNDAIASIDVEHFNIHEGHHFFWQNVVTVGSTATKNFVLTTGAKYAHLVFSIDASDAGFTLATFESITDNGDGTAKTILNNNRPSTTLPTATWREDPTGISTVGAVPIRTARVGTGSAAPLRVVGSIARSNELIMKPNTKYLMQIVNLASANNYININMSWYEE